jgi:hypothetical protein
MAACAANAWGQVALPEDARAVLRQTVTQLQAIADQYQRTGQTAAANAILNQIRSLQLTLTQSVPFARMSGYRGRVGETFRVKVTGSSASGRGIWGTDIYTDDSDLSLAVVHAGLLAADQEGEVLITFLPGQSQYQGSTRNGVITSSFAAFPGSYRIARLDPASTTVPVLPPSQPSVLGVSPGSVVTVLGANAGTVLNFIGPFGPAAMDDQGIWRLLGGQLSDNRFIDQSFLMGLRNHTGESFEYEVTGATSGAVWGDGVYTDDSELRAAAVHAGVLNPGERGRVRITILPGRQSYAGTSRNGVVSMSYNSWDSSYRIEAPQQTSSANITTASIAGRISDSSKRPVRDARVSATGPRTYTALTNAEGDSSMECCPGPIC